MVPTVNGKKWLKSCGKAGFAASAKKTSDYIRYDIIRMMAMFALKQQKGSLLSG